MPPDSGGILGGIHVEEVPFAQMLSPGWHAYIAVAAAAPALRKLQGYFTHEKLRPPRTLE